MSWLSRSLPGLKASSRMTPMPVLCPECAKPWHDNNSWQVCGSCDHHMPLGITDRFKLLLDPHYCTLFTDITSSDPLGFVDTKAYKDRIVAAREKSLTQEALSVVTGTLAGLPITVAGFDFSFIGGSMGKAVGQRYSQAIDHCIENKTALLTISASGGARMQEGVHSLIQMARVSMKCTQLAENRLPHLSLCAHPTSGGVAASMAMLGDVIFSEPKSFIGFAGPRVVQKTLSQEIPVGFQSAEYCLAQGSLDAIVPRKDQRQFCYDVLSVLLSPELKTNV